MRIIGILTISLFCLGFLRAQSTFYKIYSGSGYDVGKGVAEYPDSSFLICGSTTSWEGSSQVVLLKVDSAGTYEWSMHYGGPESDGASRVLYNSAHGVYAIGYTNSIGNGEYNGLVVHTDALGNELWKKSYGNSDSWEFFHDAVFAKDTTILMVGESQLVSAGDKDIYMVRINTEGDTLWTMTIEEPGDAQINSIVKVQDSLFIVGGSYYSQDSLEQKGFIMKLGMNGNIHWQKMVGNLEGIYSVEDISLGQDKLYVVGSRTVSESNHDSYAGVYDLDGNIMSEYTEVDAGDIKNHIIDEIAFVPNLNINVLGHRSINVSTFQDDYDVTIAYFNTLTLAWLNNFTTINNAGLDRVGQLLKTSDGGYIGVGQTTYPLSGGSNIFIFKASPSGAFPVTANYFTIDTLVGLNTMEDLEFQMYPNPSNGIFHFEFKNNQSQSISIYNSIGSLLFEKEVYSGDTIDLSDFENGPYFAKIAQHVFRLMKISP